MSVSHDSQSTNSKLVHGELMVRPVSSVPQRSIDEASQQLRSASGLTLLLQPKEKRAIARRLRAEELRASVDIGIEWLHQEADAKIVQIELAAEQRRAAILSAQNEHMGYLKHQQGALAGEAMRAEVAAESRRQAELAACDCLEEDKKLLAQLYHRRAMQNIRRIAREHGVLDSATFAQQAAGDNVGEDE